LAVRSTINTRVLLSSIFFMADSGERGKEGERQGRRVAGKEGGMEGGVRRIVLCFRIKTDLLEVQGKEGVREGRPYRWSRGSG